MYALYSAAALLALIVITSIYDVVLVCGVSNN